MQLREFKVFVVDDDAAIRRLLAKWLENEGYQYETFEGVEEALEQVPLQLPHAVLTDWEMPYATGLDLCRALREYDDSLVIYRMILTGRANRDELMVAYEAGAHDFLRKPIDKCEFLARLRRGIANTLETRLPYRDAEWVGRLSPLGTQA